MAGWLTVGAQLLADLCLVRASHDAYSDILQMKRRALSGHPVVSISK